MPLSRVTAPSPRLRGHTYQSSEKGACPRTPAAGGGGQGRPQQPGPRPFAHPQSFPPSWSPSLFFNFHPSLYAKSIPYLAAQQLPQPGDPTHATPSFPQSSTPTPLRLLQGAGPEAPTHRRWVAPESPGPLGISPRLALCLRPGRHPSSEPSGVCGAPRLAPSPVAAERAPPTPPLLGEFSAYRVPNPEPAD